MHLRGVSVEGIMKFMGWLSRRSAMIYIRPNNEDFIRMDIEL